MKAKVKLLVWGKAVGCLFASRFDPVRAAVMYNEWLVKVLGEERMKRDGLNGSSELEDDLVERMESGL